MTHEIDYTEFIERYLQNSMTSDEKAWFLKEIEGNPILQQEIDFHKKVDAVLSDRDSIDLKAQLNTIHEEIYESTEKGKGIIRSHVKRAYISAGALVTVVLLFFYLLGNNYSNETLLDLYYQPAESSLSFRDANTAGSMLSEAMTLYDNKEYEKAIQLFESILSTNKSNAGVNLYSGISYMELKDFEKANKRFQKIIENRPNPFVESAIWYLGLCYLSTNEKDKAKESFSILANGEGYYKADAKKLLRRL